jgi:uncharacterized protein (TIGR03086 family)
MDPRRALEVSVAQTRPIVAAIEPDQYGLPTPCAEWDVRGVLNHLLGVLTMWEGLPAGEVDLTALSAEHIDGDPLATYDRQAAATLAAWQADGVVEHAISFPGRELPGPFAARMLLGDVVLHGWDLAQATGQDVVWDQEIAAELLEWQHEAQEAFGPELRAHVFGPVVQVVDDVDAMTQLVAISGRNP